MFYSCPSTLMDPKTFSTKRVSRACDRCRLKKTKCDGKRCCSRCLADEAICVYSKRKRCSDRPYSPEYVQLLEDQQMKLVEGVQELYRRLRRGERWTGPEIVEDDEGYPLVQDVLESLAILPTCESRRPMRKLDENGSAEQGEDEDNDSNQQSPEDDSLGCVSSISNPATPMDYSQSSARSSSIDKRLAQQQDIDHMPSFYQSDVSKSTEMMLRLDHSSQLLYQQPLPTSEQGPWATPPLFDSSGTFLSFPEFADPFRNDQIDGSWYQNTYMP